MKNATQFVSVEESALESVAGGLLDIGNFSGNGNTVNVLSGIDLGVSVGDVGSNILNILNHVHGCCGGAQGGEGPICF
jgi:hypothetical protein